MLLTGKTRTLRLLFSAAYPKRQRWAVLFTITSGGAGHLTCTFQTTILFGKQGVAASKIIDYRFGVVRRGERGGEIPPFNEWIGKDYKVEEAYDTTLHYLLVRGEALVQPDSNLLNYQLVKTAGAWQLYKNNKMK